MLEAKIDVNRVFIRLHGFRDSPARLLKFDQKTPPINFHQPRKNQENFLSISIQKENEINCIFMDYDRLFYISVK